MSAPKRSGIAEHLAPFGTTIFATMSRLAVEHNAINLAQGFPDFDGPAFIKFAAMEAMETQHNQYAPMPGLPGLRGAIARRFERDSGLAVNPDTQVVVTSGCTEAIAATIMGICNPGDEVVLFEPFYDSYRAVVAMSGCVAKFVALRPQSDGRFAFDEAELRGAFSDRTRAVLVNTPHNPTGKVFTREELSLIATLCQKHDAVAITDEVYERLLFSPGTHPHHHLASFDGMRDRTITLSSLGKTFSYTGWKIGWAIGSAELIAGVRAAHQFLTFAVATPLQHAAVRALEREQECVADLVSLFAENRAVMMDALRNAGMTPYAPDGTYFIMADHIALSRRLGLNDDRAFCQFAVERAGIALIPPSVFFSRPELGANLVRLAFCKRRETISAAVERLAALARLAG
jgi:aspartate/methionine/tyrosine aminotransferase